MVDPVLVGGAVTAAGIAAAAGYAYFTGNDASAGVDVDGDGENEADFEFEGGNDYQPADGLDTGAAAEDTNADFAAAEGGGSATAHDVSGDVEEQADPTPDAVAEKDGLDDIKGVGPTRANSLADAGFESPEDIYYASDENLEGVHGIGPHAVSQMREDIGSIEDEAEGKSSDSDDSTETDDESDGSSSTDETENSSEEDTDSSTDGESTDSAEDGGDENTSSDE